jgi:drug/metabolite transporter (DMT)-like permease
MRHRRSYRESVWCPAVTVLLATPVLGERMRAAQRAGLALGALGIILVTA